ISVVAGEELPADLEGDERVDAGVLDLLVGEAVGVPRSHRDAVRLVDAGPYDGVRDVPEPGLAEPRPAHLVGREVAQVDGVGDPEAVVVTQAVGVVLHADADEAEVRVGEEGDERLWEVVGVEELEDEAAAADAELQERDGVLRVAVAGAPLHVQPHDELVVDPAVDVADLAEPGGHGGAGGRDGGGDDVALEVHVADQRLGGHHD
uniref:Uncharacterized protein n=1 Tax=Triticum urartu TaxID=4572 RepID=A0A8R7Q9N5_TRIUA